MALVTVVMACWAKAQSAILRLLLMRISRAHGTAEIPANNNRKIADWAFAQQPSLQLPTPLPRIGNSSSRGKTSKVQQQAVTVANKLYNDNKKQLEIGRWRRST